jgi:polyhydroxyalkanoate synthesis regulator phasin
MTSFSSKRFNDVVAETVRSAMTGPENMNGKKTREQIDKAFDGFTTQQMAEWHMVHFGKGSSTSLVISTLLKDLSAANIKANAAKTLLDIQNESEDTYRNLYYKTLQEKQLLENAAAQLESERQMNHELTQEVELLDQRVKELTDKQDRKARDDERL